MADDEQQAQTLRDAEDLASTPLLIAGAPLAASDGDAHSYAILRRKVPKHPLAWKAKSWEETEVTGGDSVAAAQAAMDGLVVTLGEDSIRLAALAAPLSCIPVKPQVQCLVSCFAPSLPGVLLPIRASIEVSQSTVINYSGDKKVVSTVTQKDVDDTVAATKAAHLAAVVRGRCSHTHKKDQGATQDITSSREGFFSPNAAQETPSDARGWSPSDERLPGRPGPISAGLAHGLAAAVLLPHLVSACNTSGNDDSAANVRQLLEQLGGETIALAVPLSATGEFEANCFYEEVTNDIQSVSWLLLQLTHADMRRAREGAGESGNPGEGTSVAYIVRMNDRFKDGSR